MVGNSHSQKSFTLVELLVVAGVMAALALAVLANWKGSGETFALQRSAHKLAQDVRRASNMAMSAKELQGVGVVPPGYGIFLQRNDDYYILYADTSPSAGNQQYGGGDSTVETIYLEEGVYIANVSPASSLSINFKPPSPLVSIQGGDTALITLSLESDSSKTKTVRVNSAGLINVE